MVQVFFVAHLTRALLPNLTTDQLALVIDSVTRRFPRPYLAVRSVWKAYLNAFFCALTI